MRAGRERAYVVVEVDQLRRSVGHHSSSPAAEFYEAFVSQVLVGAQHRVHVDAERLSNFARSRKAITGAQAAGGRIRAHRCGHLCKQGHIAGRIDSNEHEVIL